MKHVLILAILALGLGFQAFLAAVPTAEGSSGGTMAFLLGFLLLTAYVAGQAANGMGLPRITGYIILRVLVGPGVLGVLTEGNRAVKRAKLPTDLVQHDLRHRWATTWLQQGQPVHLLQKALGQSTIQVTERYSHLVTKDLQALVEESGGGAGAKRLKSLEFGGLDHGHGKGRDRLLRAGRPGAEEATRREACCPG